MPPIDPHQLPPSPLRDRVTSGLLAFAEAWNGYEVRGTEHLPADGPALIVFYHGFIPIDAWYFGAWCYQHLGRLPRALGERLLFEIPGLAPLALHMGAVPGTRENALALLAEGNLVGVSPGGVREAIAGRPNHYRLLWGERLGFAEVALAAGVPLIPAFAENIDEAYRSPQVHRPVFQSFYERTRVPVVPFLGFGLLPFPVKLRSWLGPAIRPVTGETAESLRARTAAGLQALLDAHVHPAPRLPRALVQRWRD